MSWKVKAEGGTREADRDEIRRALSILIDPGQTFELFGLPSAQSRICERSDWIETNWDAAVEAAFWLSDNARVYYRINPCRRGLEKAARNVDIVSRRWLLVDVDPVRPDGVMATDAERAEAVAVAVEITSHLAAEGWPDPAWVDSGSGVQLLYRIDLPADKLSGQWCKAILAALGDRFDTDGAKVDRGVHRLNQLAKLPGTWVRKGVHTDERPHRMARLMSSPLKPEIVTAEQLGAVAGMAAGGPHSQTKGGSPPLPPSASASSNGHANGHLNGHTKNPWGVKAAPRSLEGYVKSAISAECNRVAMAGVGNRNNELNTAAFNLGTMADWPEMSHADAKLALYEAGKAAGLGEQETSRTIASGWDGGAAKGRTRPVDREEVGGGQDAGPRNGPPVNGKPFDPNKRLIIWGKEIKPRKVDWLWPGRIPVGKATTFAGQTGMGKTFAVCDIAARVSVGGEIPFGGGECFRQGKVLIISAEDDADDTIVPRLIDLGADLSQIAFLSPAAEAEFSLAALQLLNDSLDQMAGDVRMVAIDPPTAYMGRVDDHKNAELRGLLTPLRRWTIDRQVALTMITHINKGSSGNVDAMARVMGSAAWVQAVRAAHMFAADPDEKGKGLFLPLKVNNAGKPLGIRYEIVEQPDGKVVIRWLEEVLTTADEAVGQVKLKRRPVAVDVIEWLAERFREQKEWRGKTLIDLGMAKGFTYNALNKSDQVNAVIKKDGPHYPDDGGDKFWIWRPRNPGWPPPLAESSESSESCDATPCAATDDKLSDKQTPIRNKLTFGLSELSDVSGGGSDPESARDPKLRAIRQLVGILMAGPTRRARIETIVGEMGIGIVSLDDAARELGVERTWADGEEVWSLS